jgi:hypothetical protein
VIIATPIYLVRWKNSSGAVLLQLGAAAPEGVVKLKSGSREIFKYLKKIYISYITDPLKN